MSWNCIVASSAQHISTPVNGWASLPIQVNACEHRAPAEHILVKTGTFARWHLTQVVSVFIRVPLECRLAVGFLELGIRCFKSHFQDLVVALHFQAHTSL